MLRVLKIAFSAVAILNMMYAKTAKDNGKPDEMALHLGYAICLLILWANT